MSFFTSFCDFPQNEQRSVSSVRLTIVEEKTPWDSVLLRSNHGPLGNFGSGHHLVVTADAFVTDKCALANHAPGNAGHTLRCTRHDLGNFALSSITERAAKSFGLHSRNHGRFSKLLRLRSDDLRSEIA